MSDLHTPTVSLAAASAADATLLGNLLELYSHELSSVFPDVSLGPDGRFGYPRLPLYWSEPDRRFAFVIHADDQIAGFALVTRGAPGSADADVFDVAEFFVLRRYRRLGVGRAAALLLWRRLAGTWTVRVAESNRGALAFWADVILGAAPAGVAVSVRTSGATTWRVFTFDAAIILGAG